MKFLDDIADQEEKLKLINTLRTVSDGKVRCARCTSPRCLLPQLLIVCRDSAFQIFVEVERARLTLMLSRAYEADGKVKEASETLQEIAVRCARCSAHTAVSSHGVGLFFPRGGAGGDVRLHGEA